MDEGGMDAERLSAQSNDDELILAGDVGGTHTRLALFDRIDGDLRPLHRESYESARFDGLASVVRRFLEDGLDGSDKRPSHACLALAAPLHDDRWSFPNLDWTVEPETLRKEVGLESLRLINDFDAVAWAIDQLEAEELVELQPGRIDPRAPRAFLGAGTGLGAAFSVWLDDRYRVVSSEAGHMDFAPPGEREMALLELLRDRHGHVSYERVLSGAGLHAIYESLAREGFARKSATVTRRFEREDPAAVISELGMNDADPLCSEALDVFATVYGAQAGNLALLVQAYGGVYIAGGIAPRILPKLQDGTFIRAFRDKGRLSTLLEEIPVFVVDREDVGLLGAAVAALEWKHESEEAR